MYYILLFRPPLTVNDFLGSESKSKHAPGPCPSINNGDSKKLKRNASHLIFIVTRPICKSSQSYSRGRRYPSSTSPLMKFLFLHPFQAVRGECEIPQRWWAILACEQEKRLIIILFLTNIFLQILSRI